LEFADAMAHRVDAAMDVVQPLSRPHRRDQMARAAELDQLVARYDAALPPSPSPRPRAWVRRNED
jgi:hypothetical protein